jgi:hypothetical protein
MPEPMDERLPERPAWRGRSLERLGLTPPARVISGVIALLAAAVLMALWLTLSGTGSHAYDRDPSPRGTYHVTAGRGYQLSSARSIESLVAGGVLGNGAAVACFTGGAGGQQTAITLSQTRDDPRDVHVFGLFTAAQTGDFAFRCDRIGVVFVDDADDAPGGAGSALVPLASVTAVAGLVLLLSGAYALSGSAQRRHDPSRRDSPARAGSLD